VLVLRGLVRGQGDVAPAAFFQLQEQIARHAEQEGLQLAAQRIEAEAFGQQAHEGFLHHVGGSVGRTAAQQREAVQRTLVPAVQRREGVRRIGRRAAHGAQQVGIEGVGGGSRVHG
jgi:hypothetical protein